MDLSPLVLIIFGVILGLLVVGAMLWFFAAIGAWADEAFEHENWIALAALLLFTFPGGVVAWLIIRALRTRAVSPEDFLRRGPSG